MTDLNLAGLIDLDTPDQHCLIDEIQGDYESYSFTITQTEIDEALTRRHLLLDGKKVDFYRSGHAWCVSRDELGDVLDDLINRADEAAKATTDPNVREKLDAFNNGKTQMRPDDVIAMITSVEGR